MKILYLCPDSGIPVLGRKGASVHVRELGNALARAGHAVVLAASSLTKSPWETPASVAVQVLHLPLEDAAVDAVRTLQAFHDTVQAAGSVPGAARRILLDQAWTPALTRRFLRDPPDFIYARAALYSTAPAQIARALERPLVLEVNAPISLEQTTYRTTGLDELGLRAERWLLLQADVIAAVSSPLREHIVALGVEPARVHVMPNGVAPQLFHPAMADPSVRERLKLGDGPVLGFIGGLRPWHGVMLLPRVLSQLRARHANVRLVIAGEGPLRADLEHEFGQLGLSANVVFTGALAHEDVPALIRHFDVALAPYARMEHAFYFSPLKLFEYMACGVPVVAANLGQIPEVIEDGANGMLYEPDDSDALAGACERLLNDAALRARLGKAAAQTIHANYTWDGNAARIVALARAVIDKNVGNSAGEATGPWISH